MATHSFRRIIELLEQHGVEYIIVGGVAAVLQGAPVTTFDIDALVKVDPANVERLAKALESLGARYREHGVVPGGPYRGKAGAGPSKGPGSPGAA
jgi:hypothetical protein